MHQELPGLNPLQNIVPPHNRHYTCSIGSGSLQVETFLCVYLIREKLPVQGESQSVEDLEPPCSGLLCCNHLWPTGASQPPLPSQRACRPPSRPPSPALPSQLLPAQPPNLQVGGRHRPPGGRSCRRPWECEVSYLITHGEGSTRRGGGPMALRLFPRVPPRRFAVSFWINSLCASAETSILRSLSVSSPWHVG